MKKPDNFYKIIELAILLKELNKKEQHIRTYATRKRGRELTALVDEWLEENYRQDGIDKEAEEYYFGKDI